MQNVVNTNSLIIEKRRVDFEKAMVQLAIFLSSTKMLKYKMIQAKIYGLLPLRRKTVKEATVTECDMSVLLNSVL